MVNPNAKSSLEYVRYVPVIHCHWLFFNSYLSDQKLVKCHETFLFLLFLDSSTDFILLLSWINCNGTCL